VSGSAAAAWPSQPCNSLTCHPGELPGKRRHQARELRGRPRDQQRGRRPGRPRLAAGRGLGAPLLLRRREGAGVPAGIAAIGEALAATGPRVAAARAGVVRAGMLKDWRGEGARAAAPSSVHAAAARLLPATGFPCLQQSLPPFHLWISTASSTSPLDAFEAGGGAPARAVGAASAASLAIHSAQGCVTGAPRCCRRSRAAGRAPAAAGAATLQRPTADGWVAMI
jgi:hypothetical protein